MDCATCEAACGVSLCGIGGGGDGGGGGGGRNES